MIDDQRGLFFYCLLGHIYGFYSKVSLNGIQEVLYYPEFVNKNPNEYVYVFHASYGGIAQLGERLNGIKEISGAIPFLSIICVKREKPSSGFIFPGKDFCFWGFRWIQAPVSR